MKESFILHTNAWPAIEKLTRAQRGDLLTAIMYKQMGKAVPKMDPTVEIAYLFISAQLDRDNDKYDKMVENRKAAARKRWDNASASKAMQSNAVQCLNDNENVNVNDNGNENENERYVSLAAAPLSLSETEEKIIQEEYGAEADTLIEDVRSYYTTHQDKPFPGWLDAVRLFARNQKRWGKTSAPRGTLASMQEILDRVVPED